MRRFLCVVPAVTVLLLVQASPPEPLEKAWYTPAELMTRLAQRDGISWAIPEALAGRAYVGGPATTKALLDDACKQWGLAWLESNGVHIIHRDGEARLKALGTALTPESAWEIGWLRDARALVPLSKALSSEDAALALAAAQSIERLARDIPLGRDERVEPMPPGRVPLARAFALAENLDRPSMSAYPVVRAAALRLILSHGGERARAALARSETDASHAVRLVRQQFTFTPPEKRAAPGKWDRIPPLPADEAGLREACDKMLADLPGLEKQSQWEEMQHRARILGAWARGGNETAADALIAMTTCKH